MREKAAPEEAAAEEAAAEEAAAEEPPAGWPRIEVLTLSRLLLVVLYSQL